MKSGKFNRKKKSKSISRPEGSRLRRVLAKVLRIAIAGLIGFIAATFILTILFRFLNPPFTTLMVIRSFQGLFSESTEGVPRKWAALDKISPHLKKAVIASEDAAYFEHRGVDWNAIRAARRWNSNPRRKVMLGASTIPMQTAKNVFLWPGRHSVRKLLEVYLSYLSNVVWGKGRTLEIYLNVIEWGEGVYGAEAAARKYFRKSSAGLTPYESACLAAVLPNPRRWNPSKPTAYIRRRAQSILARMRDVNLKRLED
jgi:monofunctional glycosyltransferase